MAGTENTVTSAKTPIGFDPVRRYASPEWLQEHDIVDATLPSPRHVTAVSALIRAVATFIGASIGRRPHLPQHGLRVHIVGLSFLAMLPMLAGAGFIGMDAFDRDRREADARVAGLAQTMAEDVDQQLETLTLAMQVLAASPGLEPGGDSEGFYQRAGQLAHAFGTPLVARRRDGREIFSTARPLGQTDEAAREAELVERVFATGRPVLSDIAAPPPRHAPGARLLVPVLRGGVVTASLDMTVLPDLLTSLLRPAARAGRLALVLDAAGHVAAVSRQDGIWPGQTPPVPMPAAAGALHPVMLLHAGWINDRRQLQAVAAIERAPGWHVVYGEVISGTEYDLAARPAIWMVFIIAAMAASLGVAAVGGGRLARTLQNFTAHVGASAAGPLNDSAAAKLPPSLIEEFEALRQGMARSDAVLRRRGAAERMALREARTGHELLVSVVNATAECIYVKDLDLRYVLVNRAALTSWPERLEEWQVLGRSTAELFPPAVARRIEMADRTVLATGRMTSFEQDYVPAAQQAEHGRPDDPGEDGQTRRLWMTVTPWQDAAGKVVGVVSVSRDITEQHAAGARLRGIQADLLRASRLSAMGAMASGLAHELNQPLAAATNYLNAGGRLLERGAAGDAVALRSARGVVEDAAQQMLRAGAIIRRLRHFVGRGEVELLPEQVGDLIREARDLAVADGITGSATASATGGEIDLLIGDFPTAAIVLVDRTQIQQVLLNLIRNAAEAIAGVPRGKGRPGEIVLSASQPAPDSLCIDVTDNGPGLPSEVAERLFQPFVSTKSTGMGIGLAICHTIVQGHGGVLTAGRPETGGMRFRIDLPALPQPGIPA